MSNLDHCPYLVAAQEFSTGFAHQTAMHIPSVPPHSETQFLIDSEFESLASVVTSQKSENLIGWRIYSQAHI